MDIENFYLSNQREFMKLANKYWNNDGLRDYYLQLAENCEKVLNSFSERSLIWMQK